MLKRYISLITAFVVLFAGFGELNIEAADYFSPESLIEVEDGSVSDKITQNISPYASGGVYCTNASGSPVIADADLKKDEFSYVFSIGTSAEYSVFLRAFSNSKSTFYYAWDSEDWKKAELPGGYDYTWAEFGDKYLSKGNHKLKICHGTKGVYFDALYLTSDTDFVPPVLEDAEPMPEVKPTEVSFIQKQKEEIRVGAGGAVVEAENLTLSSNVSVGKDAGASEGCYAFFNGATPARQPIKGDDGDIVLTYNVIEDGKYHIWMRYRGLDGGSDSCYMQINDGEWMEKHLSSGDYLWTCLTAGTSAVIKGSQGSSSLILGETQGKTVNTLRFACREARMQIDQFVIVPKSSYLPSGIVSEIDTEITKLTPMSGYPPYNPPANEHPRLLFTKNDKAKLIEKFNHPQNEIFRNEVMNLVATPVSVGSVYSEDKLFQIEAKAYYYALFGDEKAGREAVDAVLQTGEWTYSSFVARGAGRNIMAMSIVYDWCYDIMTDEERMSLIESSIACAQQMEIGWPPKNHGRVTMSGHGAEAQLLRDLLAFAIATYDERPDFWDYIGGRFYNEYIDERQWEAQTDIHHQGNAYGFYRLGYNLWAYELIVGMGLPEPYDGKALSNYAYTHQIYARRPDGSQFSRGDMYGNSLMDYSNPATYMLLLAQGISRDPYITDELGKVIYSSSANGIRSETLAETGPAMWLLFYEPDVEAKSVSNLPLSRYSPEPGGIMYARTGWETGVDSNVACAQLSLGYTWQVRGGHDHRDLGDFQVYYKGPLASESGYYVNWGHENHLAYYQASTPHNVMLVYDPDEPVSNYDGGDGAGYVNDGGQMVKRGGSFGGDTFANFNELPDVYRVSEITGHEIDPANPLKPDYTYLSGDLTNAYSDKVTDYKRSFMFLNFKDDTIPAALIVFDKVTSSDADFRKTWLLHGQTYPKFSSDRTEFLSDSYVNGYGEKYDGKMVVDHLLPLDYDKNVVGNEDDGWYIIDGKNIPHPDTTTVEKSAEGENYRLEISTSGNETSYFLNCIQVTDSQNKNYFSTEMIETNEFYGVRISDRTVLFSKSGEKISGEFKLESNGKNYKYTICDIEKGNWKVIAGGDERILNVTEDGGVLSFETTAETIVLQPTDSKAEPKSEPAFEEDDEVYVKIGNVPVGMPVKPQVINGKVMVPAGALKNKFGITLEKGFLKETYYDSEQRIKLELFEDSDTMLVNDVPVKLSNKTCLQNGYLMVELRAFAEAFNYKVFWDEKYSNVYLTPDKKPVVDVDIGEGYAEVISASNDEGYVEDIYGAENIFDYNLDTLWSCEGEGRYCTLELKERTLIENVEIIFNPQGTRSQIFDIQVSDDGISYETVYSGRGAYGCDGVTREVFDFDVNKEIYAKYIRYVGYGSNVSKWNGVKEVRFKIGEPILRWQDDGYANIARVSADSDSIEENKLASFATDNNNKTSWSVKGKNRYFDLELENKSEINGIGVVFKPSDNRKYRFKIQASENGKDYFDVYEGRQYEPGDGKTMEEFYFNSAVTAGYFRFVGLGNNLNVYNDVVEIRMLTGKSKGE